MTGKCRGCGECCRWIVCDFVSVLCDRKWVEGRNGEVRGRFVLLPCRCQYLTPDNRCELHGEKKPFYCVSWPSKNEKYLEVIGCKYFYEDPK